MAKAKLAVCKVCGKEYEVCKLCPNVATLTPWRRLCDTSEHFRLYALASNYHAKTISGDEAYKILNKIGTTEKEIDSFLEPSKSILKEILTFKPKEEVKPKERLVKPLEPPQRNNSSKDKFLSGFNNKYNKK